MSLQEDYKQLRHKYDRLLREHEDLAGEADHNERIIGQLMQDVVVLHKALRTVIKEGKAFQLVMSMLSHGTYKYLELYHKE